MVAAPVGCSVVKPNTNTPHERADFARQFLSNCGRVHRDIGHGLRAGGLEDSTLEGFAASAQAPCSEALAFVIPKVLPVRRPQHGTKTWKGSMMLAHQRCPSGMAEKGHHRSCLAMEPARLRPSKWRQQETEVSQCPCKLSGIVLKACGGLDACAGCSRGEAGRAVLPACRDEQQKVQKCRQSTACHVLRLISGCRVDDR